MAKKTLNTSTGLTRLPGIRPPGSTLGAIDIRENFTSDGRIPTTPLLGFGLGGRVLPLESPDRGAACLVRERRYPGALAGEEGLRSAVMVLRGGKVK